MFSMTSKFAVSQVIEGKVTGIQPYGAFVALDDETQGLVHISEVTHGFVKDINDHLAVGDQVKVKILEINEENNKISLSIRATVDAPPKKKQQQARNQSIPQQDDGTAGFNTLKGKLEDWIKQSEDREKNFKK